MYLYLQKARNGWAWGSAGIGLIVVYAMLAWLSGHFGEEASLPEMPIPTLVTLLLVAGCIFLFVAWKARTTAFSKGLLAWVILVGIVLRGIMICSAPMLEDDYYRYLWDGAVVGNGFNPYRYAPDEVASKSDRIPPELKRLAATGEAVLSRVNHPHLRTIYPPVAQATFAAAYWLKPWSLLGWRLVIFALDTVLLVLLLSALQDLDLNLLLSAIYWWNPLVLKEAFNSAHMDVLVMPLALAALMLTVRQRYLAASGVLALAVGVKLWPVALLPVVLAPVLRTPSKAVVPIGFFVLLCCVMAVPVYATGLDYGSGFIAYGRRWEMNDALYMLGLWGVQALVELSGWGNAPAQLIARVLVVLLLIVWIGWVSREPTHDSRLIWHRALLVTAALFLLSPTQFPWYYLWVIPFLVIGPRPSLLLLNILLMLYYLRFYFDGRDQAKIFDHGIVWIEFAPVWILLAWEWAKARRGEKLQAFH